MIWLSALVVVVALALLAYGLFEAGWLRTRVLEVEIDGLPEGLDGLRIAHLSDFHLGAPSRGRVATERAVAWVAGRQPDLVCITGDLVSHPRGLPLLGQLLGTLDRPYVVLGNHDVAVTRDPFSRAAELDGLEDLAVLLRDEAVVVERGGDRIQIVGTDAESYPRGTARPWELVDADGGAPDPALPLSRRRPQASRRRVPPRAGRASPRRSDRDSVTRAGGSRSRIPGGRFVAGLYPAAGGVLHVSAGTGTTFVPIRFFARPEVTELVLRAANPRLQQSS